MADLAEIVRKSCDLWTGTDLDAYMDLFHEDAVYSGPGRRVEGKDAIHAHMALFREAFPREVLTSRGVARDGNLVFLRFHATATNSGVMRWSEKRQVPPSGKTFNLEGVSVFRFQDDKIIEMEDFFDLYDLLFKQLGWNFPERKGT